MRIDDTYKHVTFGEPGPATTQNNWRDLSYDDTAVERCRGVMDALLLENVKCHALALGVRAFCSVVAYGVAKQVKIHPDQVALAIGEADVVTLFGVSVFLDPIAYRDSVRALCGGEGTGLVSNIEFR